MATTAAVLNILVKANTGQATAGLKKTDAQLARTSRAVNNVHKGFSRAAKGAIGLAGAYASVAGAKRAISTTEDLAKTTLSLHRNLGLSVKTSSEFGAVLKARGADTRQVNMAFAAFSRNVEAAKKGTESATDAFSALGISQKELQSLKPDQVINRISDGMAKLGPGTERTAIGAKLFGRGWQALVPILRGGSSELQKQLDLANKYGATFGGKSVKSIEDLIAAQREAKIASIGLQIAFGTQVAPALTKAITAVTGFVAAIRNGTGSTGRFAASVGSGFNQIKTTVGSMSSAVTTFMARNRGDVRQFGEAVTNVWNVVRSVTARVWPGIRQVVVGVLRAIGGYIKIFSGLFTGDFRKMWAGVKQVFSGSLKAIGGVIRAASAPMRAAAAAVFGPIGRVAKDVFNGIKSVVKTAIRFVLDRLHDVLSAASKIPIIGSRFKVAARGVDELRDALDGVRKRKDTTVRVRLRFSVPGVGKGELPGFGGPRMNETIRELSQRYANANAGRLGDVFTGVPGSLGKQSGALGKLKEISARMGLSAGRGQGQGFRPGDPGYHGKGRAFDSSGSASAMMRFARTMASRYGSRLAELIYTPMGFAIKNGKRVAPYAAADHYDHVHVAMAKGGMTKQPVRALVGEEGPEIVDLPQGARVHPFSRSRRMMAAMAGMIPGFASGGTVARAAHAAGFRGSNLVRAVAEAKGESGWNERAVGDGGWSKGLMQIYTKVHGWARGLNLFDPYVNMRAAMRIFRSQGWGAWHANHAPHMGAAARAVASMGGSRGRGKGRGRAKAKAPKLPQRRLPNGDILIGGRRTSELIAQDVTGGGRKGTSIKGVPPRLIPRGGFPESEAGGGAGEDPRVLAMQAVAEAIRQSATTWLELKAAIDTNTATVNSTLALQTRTAWKALVDQFAGELGTMTGQRMAGPSTGQLARF